MRIFTYVVALAAICCANAVYAQDVQEKNITYEQYGAEIDPALQLRDYHIHLRNGMTAELAAIRAKRSGVKSGVLENHGREWPLANNELLEGFISKVETFNATLPEDGKLKIGIQVNDRDWYQTIDPKLYRRLDYVLGDTMIMGKRPDGSDERLWELPKDYDADKDEWFERYFKHCMTVVNEPIDILANVTYLPEFIAADYDKYWTEERMKKLIQAAIDNNVALEIQAGSAFPKPQFIELALKMGAKLEFGSNNFDPLMKDNSAWKTAIKNFNVKADNLWRDYRFNK